MVPNILILLLQASYDMDLLLVALTALHHLLQLSQQVLSQGGSPSSPCDPTVRVNGEVYELISQISNESQYSQRVNEAATAVMEMLDSTRGS